MPNFTAFGKKILRSGADAHFLFFDVGESVYFVSKSATIFKKRLYLNVRISQMVHFLHPSKIIDFDNASVAAKAKELADGCDSDAEIAKRCFEFVRDEIRHTNDYKDDITTCKASEVLAQGSGWCYAKSHLLAALLRANNIPAAICYQRLSIFDDGAPYCLHALNAVYLRDYGWYRIDARGNKEGINAEFDPPHERLAFGLNFEGERDIEGMFAEPLDSVVEVLTGFATREGVLGHLPDCGEDCIGDMVV